MSTQFVPEKLENLPISQEQSKQTTAVANKLKGDINANFSLYIRLTPEAQKENIRYCMGAGKRLPANGITYYSKFEGKLEPTAEQVLQNFCKIIGQHSAKGSLQYANIYWNLNKGFRVNAHSKKFETNAPEVQNILLMSFDRNMKTANSCMKMYALPTFHAEEASTEKINEHHHRLLHEGIPTKQAQAIVDYLDYYFNTLNYTKAPDIVKVSNEPPQREPQPPQQTPQPETPQEPTPQTQPEPQASIAQQVTARTEAYKLPPLQKPKPQAVTQAQKITAEKEIIQGRRQIEEKDKFLQQLACTQTSLKEKLNLYQLIYPADPIFKIEKGKRESFLSEILTAYL